MSRSQFTGKSHRGMLRVILALVLAVTLMPGYSSQASGPDAPIFGVLNDAGQHYGDEWARGVRATTFVLTWASYEPERGVYDIGYVNQKKEELRQLNAQGWYVTLILGFHYVPQWVFDTYSDMYFVNQYGDLWYGNDAEGYMLNAPFNPQARSLLAKFIRRIFTDFDPDEFHFDAVRVGGGTQGELRYPPTANGANSYWAFDRHAQDAGNSGIPASVIGWRPGIDPNPGSVGRGQLIVNPGFEQDHAYFPALGWAPEDEVAIARTPRSTGGQALEVVLTTPHRVHQFVPVDASAPYQFGGCLLSVDGSKWARIFFSQYTATMEPISGAPFGSLATNATTWECQSDSITTSADTHYLKVELDGNQPGTYYFDDLWLKHEGAANSLDRDIFVPVAFYDWYVQKLIDFQNWQISKIRKYYQGQLDLTYAGKGYMREPLTDALTNDLRGNGWSESNSALYAGALYDRIVAGLTATQGIALYNTGIEDPASDQVDDASPYPGKWSAAHWIAHLAQNLGAPVWGENSGQDHFEDLQLAVQRVHDFGFAGMMWGFESELYADPNPHDYATIDEYEAIIANYPDF